jgi:tRNA-splicing ligase RtcB
MAERYFDCFTGSFADRQDRGVRFLVSPQLLGPLLESEMVHRVTRIARLPYLDGLISLYADASPKPFGFPAGIVIRTQPGWLYPMAAPDMGCGYLVVDTGIRLEPEAVKTDVLASALDEMVYAVGLHSPGREMVRHPVDEILRHGLSAIGGPAEFSADACPAEEGNSWKASLDVLGGDTAGASFQHSLGSAAGHFVACYAVVDNFPPHDLETGAVLAVVHVGSAPIRDHLNNTGFYARLAENSISSGIASIEDAADGLFPVDISTAEGKAFLGAAMAARNFGYANRQLVADRVVRILRRRFSAAVVSTGKQLRHVDHVAFEAVGEGIRSRRGLQPLHAERLVFITGGEHTLGYLCSTGPNSPMVDGLCCHGAPVRDVEKITPHISDDPSYGIESNVVLYWAANMASNTSFDYRRFWSDVANLESVMAYLRHADIAHPAARLRPLLNYREKHL